MKDGLYRFNPDASVDDTMYANYTAYRQAKLRADGQCEVFVQVSHLWTRCPGWGQEVHHTLPRSRGGLILDEYRESYALLVCCRKHHLWAHQHPADAYEVGLLIDGYVTTRIDGRPFYIGSDRYLSERYGDHDELEEAPVSGLADHPTPRPLAGPAQRRPVAGLGRAVGGRSTRQWSA